VGGEEWGGG
jgi:hypothetical protein